MLAEVIKEMVMTDERLLTVRDITDRLKVHENTVLGWLKQGKLSGYRLGGTRAGWRIPEGELQRFLSERWREGASDSEVVKE